MSSINSRFKNLVGSSRRKSQNPSPTPQGASTPTIRPASLSPQTNSSSSSLPTTMNPGQHPVGRPPSYTYAPPNGLAPAQQHGRPASPLPPINTGAPAGYPPQQMGGYPPQGPPGYPPQPPQAGGYGGGYGAPPPAPAPAAPHAQAAYNRPGVAEVAGEGRSKAQLIVGIDFVSRKNTKEIAYYPPVTDLKPS